MEVEEVEVTRAMEIRCLSHLHRHNDVYHLHHLRPQVMIVRLLSVIILMSATRSYLEVDFRKGCLTSSVKIVRNPHACINMAPSVCSPVNKPKLGHVRLELSLPQCVEPC